MAGRLTNQEWAAVQDPTPFEIKGRVIRKMWNQMDVLRGLLIREVEGTSFLGPAGADLHKGQLAKGENHQSLPFVFMDLPQLFQRDEMFTFRTFFWWGHGLYFALILSGAHLPEYKRRVLLNYTTFSSERLILSVQDSPWVWTEGNGSTLTLTPRNRTRVGTALKRLSFLKIMRHYPIHHPVIRNGRLSRAGLEAFRLMKPILTQ